MTGMEIVAVKPMTPQELEAQLRDIGAPGAITRLPPFHATAARRQMHEGQVQAVGAQPLFIAQERVIAGQTRYRRLSAWEWRRRFVATLAMT